MAALHKVCQDFNPSAQTEIELRRAILNFIKNSRSEHKRSNESATSDLSMQRGIFVIQEEWTPQYIIKSLLLITTQSRSIKNISQQKLVFLINNSRMESIKLCLVLFSKAIKIILKRFNSRYKRCCNLKLFSITYKHVIENGELIS